MKSFPARKKDNVYLSWSFFYVHDDVWFKLMCVHIYFHEIIYFILQRHIKIKQEEFLL